MSGVKAFYFGENGQPLPQYVIYEREQKLLESDPGYTLFLNTLQQEHDHETVDKRKIRE